MATAKEHLRQWIEEIDEAEAERVLALVQPEALDFPPGPDWSRFDPVARAELLRNAKPITEDDPIWDIIGMASSDPDGPDDIAENHDKYLAEINAAPHDE